MTAALALVHTGGEPRVHVDVLAAELGLQRESVMRLVNSYTADFEQFGKVRFEIRASAAGQKTRAALLNEDQSYLLLSFSRNTRKVRSLKVKLVSAFADARNGKVRRGLSFFHQRLVLETKDANSKVKASFGSKLMHERRRELPAIRRERAELQAAMQPALPMFGP